jgi:hypothetical protein
MIAIIPCKEIEVFVVRIGIVGRHAISVAGVTRKVWYRTIAWLFVVLLCGVWSLV